MSGTFASVNWSTGTALTAVFRIAFLRLVTGLLFLSLSFLTALAQDKNGTDEDGLGPVVTAYLGYLKNEQEVVDDRASRKEISHAYYRRNSNRIRALREMAIRIAHESANDYLPELEAAAADELGTLFEHPPAPASLHSGDVLNFTLRYLGMVRAGDSFYLFARLDPYEQAELRAKGPTNPPEPSVKPQGRPPQKTRPRRVHDRKQT